MYTVNPNAFQPTMAMTYVRGDTPVTPHASVLGTGHHHHLLVPHTRGIERLPLAHRLRAYCNGEIGNQE
jgi:hypothetical protein